MQQYVPHLPVTVPQRTVHPVPFRDRSARLYWVSFRIAEEATWDHRFHDTDGREIPGDALDLRLEDHGLIQASCDRVVGTRRTDHLIASSSDRRLGRPASHDSDASPA